MTKAHFGNKELVHYSVTVSLSSNDQHRCFATNEHAVATTMSHVRVLPLTEYCGRRVQQHNSRIHKRVISGVPVNSSTTWPWMVSIYSNQIFEPFINILLFHYFRHGWRLRVFMLFVVVFSLVQDGCSLLVTVSLLLIGPIIKIFGYDLAWTTGNLQS